MAAYPGHVLEPGHDRLMPAELTAADYRERIENALNRHIPASETEPAQLRQAMRYAVLGNGKRIRPRLVYAAGKVLDVPIDRLDTAACAVELIHAYSLIHDDLPAMDDDVLRRGRPTTHVAFGDATAILAGDALQALAFDLLATDPAIGDDPATRARLMASLARACGSDGMVGGQALDMASEGKAITLDELKRIHHMKTGALLRACVLMAADYRPDLPADRRRALDTFGMHIGLVFQMRDDILDVVGTTEQLGKTSGADEAHHKATYPALLGLEGATEQAEQLYRAALEALQPFGATAEPLRDIARLIAERDC